MGGQRDILLPLDGGSSRPLPSALFRRPQPLMVSVPGPAAGREPSTPGGAAETRSLPASGAAVPGSVQLALSILHALLYAALRLCLPAAVWRLLTVPRAAAELPEPRASSVSLCGQPLYGTIPPSPAPSSLSGSLPLLRPPAHLHFFPTGCSTASPPVSSSHALSLQPLPGGVRREDRRGAGRESGAAAFHSGRGSVAG